MRTHPLRFAALAVALLAFGTSLPAQGYGPGCGCRRGGFGPGQGAGLGLRGLNLSADQQAKVKAIHENHQAAFKTKGDATQAAHQALREAMLNPATDAKTLQALHEKASAAQFDLMLEHRAVRQEILPLLTPEQKAQFEKGPMGMGPRGGRGRGPGFGRGMNPDCPMVKPS
ncbi:MAG: Spy/CpxP family protein refolding chaperone [Geothrix sp.]|nr:Spy/CpxP family protein refolding chaperone [Geothrix sp.]